MALSMVLSIVPSRVLCMILSTVLFMTSCKEQTSTPTPVDPVGLGVGSRHAGGVVFSVQTDSAGRKHGLVASASDLSGNADWLTAKRQCQEYRGGGYDDWYLPSKGELKTLFDNRVQVNAALLNVVGTGPVQGVVWSSTEFSSASAYRFSFTTGLDAIYIKDGRHDVRAVRRF
ncbi:MAG: DUF1566 domain-containing protein [Candidatus Kapaibacterium sp.]